MNGNEVSLARAIRGPVTLITLGVLFALNNFTQYQFHETWPVLLIVFGLLSLLRRSTEPPPPPVPQHVAWPPSAAPAPPSVPESGSYREGPYTGGEPPHHPSGGAA
jgi:hypothetical protein